MGCNCSKKEYELLKEIVAQLNNFTIEVTEYRKEMTELTFKLERHLETTLPYRCIESNVLSYSK